MPLFKSNAGWHRQVFRLLVALSFVSATSVAGARGEPACKTLVASGNPEYPPLLWLPEEQSSTLTGALPELLHEIVEPLGVEVGVRDLGSWARVQRTARLGEIDLVAGAFVTEERQDYLDYVSPPVTWLPSNVWVPAGDRFSYRYWTDLRGRTGSTLIDNSFGQEFDRFADEHLDIEGIRTIEQSFRMAKADRVDYVLYEKLQGGVTLANLGLSEDFVALEPPISSERLHIAFSQRSPCNTDAFRKAFAERLAEVTRERRIDALVEKYTRAYLERSQ